ncbi:hypothetical protein H6F32_09640 [Anabaena sp. FACHB-1237]|uniref:hypothetical protein n=1 Tax=Anabaena sp. FACHB-1237 TaxID=2692769 RepID=UPI001680104D|nr:hypothetical protein [Anabaena sp. FACHB-1237]MBD2137844.1 hypothetical protein [Anabaena sp. FACHB-1237]
MHYAIFESFDPLEAKTEADNEIKHGVTHKMSNFDTSGDEMEINNCFIRIN